MKGISTQTFMMVILIVLFIMSALIVFVIGYFLGIAKKGGFGVMLPPNHLPPPNHHGSNTPVASTNLIQSEITNLSLEQNQLVNQNSILQKAFEMEKKENRRHWGPSALGLIISVILLFLIGGGYYFYYRKEFASTPVTVKADTANDPATGGDLTKNVAAAQKALTNSSGDDIDTSGWQKFSNSNYAYTLTYPTNWGVSRYKEDWNLDPKPANSEGAIRLNLTANNTAGLYVQIRALLNPNKLEAGAFASVNAIHNNKAIKSRTAAPLFGMPSVRYITDDGKERAEITYASNSDGDVIITLEIHAPNNISLEDPNYLTAKRILSQFKFN